MLTALKITSICILSVIILYLLLLAISALLVHPGKEYTTNSRFYRFLLNSSTTIALKLIRVRPHCSGMEHLPETGRFLLVCNHRSNYDPIVTWHVLRTSDLAFISKADNFKIPIWGRLIRKCCFMAIDRENPKKAFTTIQNAAHLIQADECSVAVYPEGTRSKNLELLPFHHGVFKIAQKAHVPIVVMTIRGTESIYKNIPFHHTDVYLNITSTISADDVKAHRTSELEQMIRELMLEDLSHPI